MAEMTTITTTDLANLEERVKKLAADKSYLQLTIHLMDKLSAVPGLDNTIENMLRNVNDVIGGTNVILYYVIDQAVYYADVYGKKQKLDTIDDHDVRMVFERRDPTEQAHDFSHTKMMTPEFSQAFTWIIPLQVGTDLIGVVKMENLHLSIRALSQQLPAFFNYAALILKNEILGHTQLKRAYDELEKEAAVRQCAEQELRLTNEALEERIAKRTAELQSANEQLRSTLENEQRVTTALKEQYSTLRSIIDGSDAIVFSVDRQYRYTSFNHRHAAIMKALYGVEIENGRSLLDYMSVAEDRETAKCNIDRAFAGEQIVEEAYSGEEPRSRQYFRVAHSPVRSEDGGVIGAAVLAQDMTGRRRSEEALQASEENYRALIQKIQAAVVVHGADTRILSCNPKSQELLGLTEDQLMGKTAVDPSWHFLREDGAPMPTAEYPANRVIATRQPLKDLIMGVHRPDKQDYVWALVNADPVLGKEDEITQVIVTFIDITALRRTEETLRKSEAGLKEAQRVGRLGSWDWDAKTDTITWSEEYYCIYGLDPAMRPPGYEEHLKAYTPESAARLDAAVKRNLQTGEPYEIDLELAGTGGPTRWITARSETRRDLNGQITGLRGTAQDITERKRAEDAQRRLNRELRAISNCNQALLRAVDEQSMLNEICSIICDEAGYRMAWVGYAENDEAKTVYPIAWGGVEDGYLSTATILWADTENGHGPTGVAIRNGKSACTQDFTTDPQSAPWREQALQRGYRSSIALPLKDESAGTFGALNIYSTQPNAFTPDEIRLLEELANDMAFGINVLRARSKLHQSRQNLQEANDLLRAIIETAPTAIIGLDLEGKVQTVWNPAAEKLLGWSAQEAIGNFLPSVPPEKETEFRQFLDLMQKGKTMNGVEVQQKRRDGTPINYSIYASPLYNAEEQIIGNITVLVDITERKKAEIQLLESEQLFRALVENSPDFIARYDRDFRRVYVNPAIQRLFADSVGSVIGRTPIDQSPIYAPLIYIDHLQQVIETATESIAEIPFRTAQGEMHWGQIRFVPEFAPSGEVASVLAIGRDIHEIKENERRFRMLAENFPDLIVRFDRYERLIYVNPAVERAFGTPADAVVGKTLDELPDSNSEKNAGLLALIQHVSDEGIPNETEVYWDTEMGKRIFDIRYIPERDAAGDVVNILSIARDITERKQAEEERQAHLHFLESMDQVNRAIQGSNDLEQTMSDVLDLVLSIFECDRAFLMHPCDPNASVWKVPVERNRPEYPGAFALGLEMPMTSEVAETLLLLLASDGPVKFGPGTAYPLPENTAERFGFKSFMSMALYPKIGSPWQFGIHQCSYARTWTADEERLFQEIGRRLSDALTSLLSYHNLQDSQEKLKEAQRIAHVGYWDRDIVGNRITLSEESCRIFGISAQEAAVNLEQWHKHWLILIHPEDQQRTGQAASEALRGGPRYDVEYRIIRPDGDVRHIHSEANVTWDEAGHPIRMMGIMWDITEQKQAREALLKSEQRYRMVFENSPVSIWEEDFSEVRILLDDLKNKGVTDITTYLTQHPETVRQCAETVKIVDVNQAALALHAAANKEDLLANLVNTFTQESFDTFRQELICLWNGKTETTRDGIVKTLAGEPRNVTVSFSVCPGYEGTLSRVIVSLIDITERKRAEQALRESEWRYREIFDNVLDGLYLLEVTDDGRFRTIEINPALERLTGIPRSFSVGKTQEETVPAEVAAIVNAKYRHCVQAGHPIEEEVELDLPAGRRYFHSTLIPARDENGKIHRIIGISRDITARKLAEGALRESEARYRMLFNVMEEGVAINEIVHDEKGEVVDYTILEVNPSFTKNSLFTREQILGKRATELYHMSPEFIRNWWEKHTEIQQVVHTEMHYAPTNRWFHITTTPPEGNRFATFSVDITDRKRAEEEIHQLNQELEQRVIDRTAQLKAANDELEAFAYSVSHDLRAPLRHIDGFIELLEKRTKTTLDVQSQHYLNIISSAAKHMGTLIDDLLSFSRMGRFELSKTQIDLQRIVQNVIQELGPEVGARNIDWLIGDLPTIKGDPALLKIVLVNLISNAVKYTRPRQRAEIEIGCLPDTQAEVILFVRDNGVGFDTNYASKLFGVFQRLHRVDEFEGNGIGLATVRRIVSRHGGRTWAQGEVDHGATFYFSLPSPDQGE